ncbi:MAG: hypothetical protein Q9218_008348 [Villophora microphyllina]
MTKAHPAIQSCIAKANKPERPDGPLQFFLLSGEIRNMIYRYVVRFPKGVVKAKKISSKLQLFLANRQFFLEASAIFFAENTFTFYSCYVQAGSDPFGPRPDRIQRCLLHLSSTQSDRNDFLLWFNREFVRAVTPNHSLKYLIIRVAFMQLAVCAALSNLSGIEYAQVDLGCPPKMPSTHPSLLRNQVKGKFLDQWRGSGEGRKDCFQQMLERMLMYEGRPRPDNVSWEIFHECCEGEYVREPCLTMGKQGEGLTVAKKKGGWQHNHELYDFLKITRNKMIRVG